MNALVDTTATSTSAAIRRRARRAWIQREKEAMRAAADREALQGARDDAPAGKLAVTAAVVKEGVDRRIGPASRCSTSTTDSAPPRAEKYS